MATPPRNEPLHHFAAGLMIGCLSLGVIIFGSVGACLGKSFLTALPHVNQVRSFSGYANVLMLGISCLIITGLCLTAIFVILKNLKSPNN